MRKLRDYQKLMLKYCMETQNPFLAVQMRLGKTIVTIRSTRVKGSHKNLVVAPYSALYSWMDELEKENQYQHGVIELFGNRKQRLHSLEEKGRWFLLNKEGHYTIPEVADIHWNSVILDESHFIKGARTGVSDFYIQNFRNADTRYCLTGTPAPESELDYYNQIRFLGHNYWKEKNFYQFKHKNFGVINYEAYISPEGSKYLTKTLARRCYFLSRDDVNLGGIKIYETRYVELSPKVRAIYNQVEKEFVLSYLDEEQETIYATTKYIWLRRLCGGFADKEFISYTKIKELKYLMDTELKNQPLVILCKHVNEVRKVTKYLSKWWKIGMIYGDVDKKKARPKIIKDFQEGRLDHVCCQPESVKNGTDFSRSDVIVFYSTPDPGETRQQVEDRIVNTSTNNSNLIIDLICKHTVEEKALKSVKRKESKQKMMKRLVKELQKKHNIVKYKG